MWSYSTSHSIMARAASCVPGPWHRVSHRVYWMSESVSKLIIQLTQQIITVAHWLFRTKTGGCWLLWQLILATALHSRLLGMNRWKLQKRLTALCWRSLHSYYGLYLIVVFLKCWVTEWGMNEDFGMLWWITWPCSSVPVGGKSEATGVPGLKLILRAPGGGGRLFLVATDHLQREP